MIIGFTLFLIAALLFLGLKAVCSALEGNSTAGRRALAKLSKWEHERHDLWATFPLRQLVSITSRLVFLDEVAYMELKQELEKAGLPVTPQEYIARKYLTIAAGVAMIALCVFLRFYFGILVATLGLVFVLMKQRDTLKARVGKKEQAISQEMPRFVRTLCRSLQTNRDLVGVIQTYRKAAGPELGRELDILLAEMLSGNMQSALIHFENQLRLPEVSRLCGALRDMSMGIDQTATLAYMADDMARQAQENVKRELSLRPEKMRRTYYPAIGVCIAMILYVLIIYVINNLNNIT